MADQWFRLRLAKVRLRKDGGLSGPGLAVIIAGTIMRAPEGEGMGDIDGERRSGEFPVGVREEAAGQALRLRSGLYRSRRSPIAGWPMVDAACARTAAFLRAAKAPGMPAVAHSTASPSPAAAPYSKVAPAHDLPIGTPGAMLDPRMAELEPHGVLGETAPSIVFGAPAAAMLTREGGATR